MPSPLMFWIYVWIAFAAGVAVGYNHKKRKLEEENYLLQDALYHSGYDWDDCIDCGGPPHNEYCRFWKLRHLFPLWFEGQEDGNCFFCSEPDCHNECLTETTGGGDE